MSKLKPHAPWLDVATARTFPSVEKLARVSDGKDREHFYRRYGHENSVALEEAVKKLEGAEDAVALSSGMGACVSLFGSLVSPGDHIVSANNIYGGTYSYFLKYLSKSGARISFVRPEIDQIRRAVTNKTKIIFFEIVSNPHTEVPDIDAIVAFAKEREILTATDNTVATPVLFGAVKRGIDIAYYSGTKFLNGHGDALSGVVAGPSEIIRRARKYAIATGLTISPLDAWLTWRGMRTLEIRVKRSCENAHATARFLSTSRAVKRVYYCGLQDNPFHARAAKYLRGGFGALLSFELNGGVQAVERFVSQLRTIEMIPSFGDVSTTISHPDSSSHRYLPVADRRRLNITPALVRLSAGIEPCEKIIEELEYALASK